MFGVWVRPRLRVDKIQTHKGLKGADACCLFGPVVVHDVFWSGGDACCLLVLW